MGEVTLLLNRGTVPIWKPRMVARDRVGEEPPDIAESFDGMDGSLGQIGLGFGAIMDLSGECRKDSADPL